MKKCTPASHAGQKMTTDGFGLSTGLSSQLPKENKNLQWIFC